MAIETPRNTIVTLRELSADEQKKREAYYREKRLHDEATALGNARCEGIAKGIIEGKISVLTGLVRNGILTVADAAQRADMSVSEFEAKAKSEYQ